MESVTGPPRRSLLIARLRGDLRRRAARQRPAGHPRRTPPDHPGRRRAARHRDPGRRGCRAVRRQPDSGPGVAEDPDRRGPGRPPAPFRVHRRAADAGRTVRDLCAARRSRAGRDDVRGARGDRVDDDRAVSGPTTTCAWRRRVPTTGATTGRAGGFTWPCWRRPSTQRLLRMLESAWNLTEPVSADGADPGNRTGRAARTSTGTCWTPSSPGTASGLRPSRQRTIDTSRSPSPRFLPTARCSPGATHGRRLGRVRLSCESAGAVLDVSSKGGPMAAPVIAGNRPLTLDEFNAADPDTARALLGACLDIERWVSEVVFEPAVCRSRVPAGQGLRQR